MAWLAFGLATYWVSTLVSMAAMSIGLGVFLVALLVSQGGPKAALRLVRDELQRPASRLYFKLAFLLFLACALSLAVAAIFPITYKGKGVEVHFFRGIAKAWYLFWPLVLAAALRVLPELRRAQVIRAWLGGFGFLALVGIAQFFTGWPRPSIIPGNEAHFHVNLFLGHHLSVASVMICDDLPLLRRAGFSRKQREGA
jgi:hypothetical protein